MKNLHTRNEYFNYPRKYCVYAVTFNMTTDHTAGGIYKIHHFIYILLMYTHTHIYVLDVLSTFCPLDE